MSSEICPYLKAKLIMLRGGLDEAMECWCKLTEHECCEDSPATCGVFYDMEKEEEKIPWE